MPALNTEYYVYILLCENGSLYTGYTSDLKRRYQEHSQGSSKCKYTRSFKPIRIAQSWKILDGKEVALKIERFIKSLRKSQKLTLVADPHLLNQYFPNCHSLQDCN